MPEERLPRYYGGYNNSKQLEGVRRVNAGGQKAGLPLIITGGKARFDAFHYNFTDKGKYKKQPRPGEVELRVKDTQPKRELFEKIKFKLPRNFCPDCNRTDLAHEKGVINVWTMYDGAPDLGLQPNDVIVSFWCQQCQMNGLYGKRIKIPGEENGLNPEGMDEWRKAQIRQVRMDRNIEAYIRNRLLAGDTSIVIDEEFKRTIQGA